MSLHICQLKGYTVGPLRAISPKTMGQRKRSEGRWPHLLTLLVLSLGANFCMNGLVAAEPTQTVPIQHQDIRTSPKMVVGGVVYCETAYNLGSDSSRLAAHHEPLKDATVKVECNNRWARATEYGKTDAQGMFSLTLQNYDYEVWGAKGCQAKLVSSSHASCTTPTNMSGGLVGTKLVVKNRSKDKVTLSVGPFAFKQATVGSKSQERKLMEGSATKTNSPELWYSPPYDQSPNYGSPPYYDNNHHNSHGSYGHGDQGGEEHHGGSGYGDEGRHGCENGNCGGGGSGYGNSREGHGGSSEHRGDNDRDGHRRSSGRDCSPGYEDSHHRSGGYYRSPPPYYDHHNSPSRHHSSPYYQSPPYNNGDSPPSPNYYNAPPEYHSPHSPSRHYSPSPEYRSPPSSSNHHGQYPPSPEYGNSPRSPYNHHSNYPPSPDYSSPPPYNNYRSPPISDHHYNSPPYDNRSPYPPSPYYRSNEKSTPGSTEHPGFEAAMDQAEQPLP